MAPEQTYFSYSPLTRPRASPPGARGGGGPADDQFRPEPADVFRLGRRLVRLAVSAARAEDHPLRRVLHDHLGPQAASMPTVSGSWLQYDHVNVQIGLDAWLDGAGRQHELIGITGFQHSMFGLAELAQPGRHYSGLGVGNVATVALPAGPGGQTRPCVRCGLYLISEDENRYALLLRSPDHPDPMEEITLEVVAKDAGQAERILGEIRQLAVERNVFRGQVIAFGGEMFGHGRGSILSFLDRPRTASRQRRAAARPDRGNRAAGSRRAAARGPAARQRAAPQARRAAVRRAREPVRRIRSATSWGRCRWPRSSSSPGPRCR